MLILVLRYQSRIMRELSALEELTCSILASVAITGEEKTSLPSEQGLPPLSPGAEALSKNGFPSFYHPRVFCWTTTHNVCSLDQHPLYRR